MKNRKGFTLVEILIVVIILGILAAIVIPQFTGDVDKEQREYSMVVEYMQSNYCAKMLYPLHSPPPCKICLVRYDGHQEFFELNKEDFLDLKEMLKKGGELGTWTFELVVTDPPGAPDSLVWHGTRSQKQKEKANSTKTTTRNPGQLPKDLIVP